MQVAAAASSPDGVLEVPLHLRPTHLRRPAVTAALRTICRPGARRVVGVLAALTATVAAAGACVAVVAHPAADRPAASVLTIRPLLPPPGGFAVASDRMSETLAALVATLSGEPARAARQGQSVLVEVTPDGVRRAVQTGSVLVGAAPYLVEVAVRRAPGPACASGRCADVRDHPGSPTRPHSVEAVVDADGVEVAVRVWNGPRRDAAATRQEMPLSADGLLSLAADTRWRR